MLYPFNDFVQPIYTVCRELHKFKTDLINKNEIHMIYVFWRSWVYRWKRSLFTRNIADKYIVYVNSDRSIPATETPLPAIDI